MNPGGGAGLARFLYIERMNALESALERRLAPLTVPLAVVLPGGRRFGDADAAVTLRLHELSPLAHLATGEVGRVAQDYVEGKLDFDGSVRDMMDVAVELLAGSSPTESRPTLKPLAWWRNIMRAAKSRAQHQIESDAMQIQFHYDVSDDFYAMWLDDRRVYSCAYWRSPGMTLADAQVAKLDHVCRKLMLREGERFLDVGAGWGGLLLWAAEQYGVKAHGITLSKNQHAHVNRLIDERGLRGRVTMDLCDYRDLSEEHPYDKISSIGMFEHVGHVQLPAYFAKLRRLLKSGGLLMNHGITAGGTQNDQLGAGMGDFIERYIFPGGELLHVSHVLKVLSEARLESLDTENLRPHYARTLWAWSDRLEAQLTKARDITRESVVRAYRLYLAGSAMSFEQGWISLYQMLASHPSGDVTDGPLRGAQSGFPFNREYMYNSK
jgi:cyclopropane-fatty-acyl-phospholipid synthase